MPRFSISSETTFAPDARLVVNNNLYWNAGKPIPTGPGDMLVPDRDAKRLVADPRIGNPVVGVTLPRWDANKACFLSGRHTVRAEFERLVQRYAALGRQCGHQRGRPFLHAARQHFGNQAQLLSQHWLLRPLIVRRVPWSDY